MKEYPGACIAGIRDAVPEVERLESQLSALQSVRRQLLRQIQQLRYGVE